MLCLPLCLVFCCEVVVGVVGLVKVGVVVVIKDFVGELFMWFVVVMHKRLSY